MKNCTRSARSRVASLSLMLLVRCLIGCGSSGSATANTSSVSSTTAYVSTGTSLATSTLTLADGGVTTSTLTITTSTTVCVGTACGSPTTSVSSSSASGSSTSGLAATACGDYWDAWDKETRACQGGPVLPVDENARERTRYVIACENLLALPGQGLTADQYEACAKLIASDSSCRFVVGGAALCNFAAGSLPTGASCRDNSQCASSTCTPGYSDTCGKCAAAADTPVGQPCQAAPNSCAAGSFCSMSTWTCQARTFGDLGASCDANGAGCNLGLYCDLPTMKCAAQKPSGAACNGREGDECVLPLLCRGTPSTCQSLPQSGVACQGDSTCALGFGCSLVTNQCGQVSWASPGQSCGDLVRCLVGDCPVISGGKCPNVIADGQPCQGGISGVTCDFPYSCVDGVCADGVGGACP